MMTSNTHFIFLNIYIYYILHQHQLTTKTHFIVFLLGLFTSTPGEMIVEHIFSSMVECITTVLYKNLRTPQQS